MLPLPSPSDRKAGAMRRVNTEDYVVSNCSMTRKFSYKKSEFLRFNL